MDDQPDQPAPMARTRMELLEAAERLNIQLRPGYLSTEELRLIVEEAEAKVQDGRF